MTDTEFLFNFEMLFGIRHSVLGIGLLAQEKWEGLRATIADCRMR
ncbi:hypothetical protein D1AOALGA4SA_10633 [Olavius algarvensis Delta 1 endosymbiont]|nr:hypothetical protein D1AOALGA4SA_10633 [Olavius algarvensis Delta 1 endosymbiont]